MMLKQGVSLKGLTPQIIIAAIAANEIYKARNIDFVITSANDSTHSTGSLHYSGNAIDIRTRQINPVLQQVVCKEIQAALGDEFDVVLEADHIHIEYDPT